MEYDEYCEAWARMGNEDELNDEEMKELYDEMDEDGNVSPASAFFFFRRVRRKCPPRFPWIFGPPQAEIVFSE